MEYTHKTCYLTANYDRYLGLPRFLRYMNNPYISAGDWNATPLDYLLYGFPEVFPAALLHQ
eukprot:9468741-Pyramimonas_sp.AAC.1